MALKRFDHLPLEERIRARDRQIDAISAKRLKAARAQKTLSIEDEIDKIINRRQLGPSRAWRTPSIREALSVPSILRAVSLISSTTGMLSVQGYRNGVLMTETPKVLARPDPDNTPYTFYSTTASQMAKAGEFVWWIASRDSDDQPSALINVPLSELQVEDNPNDRRRARYRWGTITSTRYSPANPQGAFVHHKYPIGDPFALRGEGPLQIAKAATSVSVEAQTWAANFFAKGGYPREVIKHAGILDPTLRDQFGEPDPTSGVSEADRLKAQYVDRDINTPIVIDQAIEGITRQEVNPQGAQMLEARLHQNGDAARMFGLPGKFVEYVQSGTSLTYQSLESAFTDLVKTCLQPLYLEPIEQALSDLLTRSTAARFNIKGFLRADIKTRAEVYNLLVPLGIISAEEARQEEGYAPGDVEYAPVAFAPPAAIPARIPGIAQRQFNLIADWRCSACGLKLLEQAGPGTVATCRRCKTRNEILEPLEIDEGPVERRLEIHNHFPPDFVRVESPVTVNPPDVHATFNAPEPAPLTLNVAIPQTEMSVAAMAERVAEMTAGIDKVGKDLAFRSLQVDERLTEIASAQDALAAKVAEPRKARQFKFERDANNKIIKVIEAA